MSLVGTQKLQSSIYAYEICKMVDARAKRSEVITAKAAGQLLLI